MQIAGKVQLLALCARQALPGQKSQVQQCRSPLGLLAKAPLKHHGKYEPKSAAKLLSLKEVCCCTGAHRQDAPLGNAAGTNKSMWELDKLEVEGACWSRTYMHNTWHLLTS